MTIFTISKMIRAIRADRRRESIIGIEIMAAS